ncbi:MAG: M20/M25/M40 family metallo-hydrolase [Planctomycetota bacterium]|nr:MAG: M20/M25/M40 family metallo-hydrolase [Planctomycetota bacterium]
MRGLMMLRVKQAIRPTAAALSIFGLGFLGLISLRAADLADVDERLVEDVKTLASDEYEGRGVGTEGLEKAAEYIRGKFEKAGLDVTAHGGDPFQEFEITTGAELTSPNTLTFRGPDGEELEPGFEVDFHTCSFGDAGKFSGEVVFAGYGIESEDPAYNSFEGLDVAGKVVIIVRRNPQQGQEEGLFAVAHGASRHAALATKVSHAFQREAAAVLFVNDTYTGLHQREQLQQALVEAEQKVLQASEGLVDSGASADDAAEARETLDGAVRHYRQVRMMLQDLNADPLMDFGYGGTRVGKSLPVMHITQALCNQLLETSTGQTLAEWEAKVDETGKPQSTALEGWTAVGETGLRAIRVPIANVVGVLEGEGPRADETVVIGAHYDHVGRGGVGSLSPGSTEIHNGADDNASGTAALLEVARRLAAREEKLPRRVVFIAFTGEERGLLGSAHYVREPIFPLEDTIAMINMDMVGRLEEDRLTVFGTGTSPAWDAWIDAAAEEEGLVLAKKPEGFGPSDHSSFYAKQIPVLHLFTGTHSDYHRPTDDWDKINFEGIERIADLVETLTVEVARTEERPEYVEVQGRASMTRSGSRPYFGSIPDFSSDADGYALQGVAPGSPAEKGGLKGGDVIIKFGGAAIGGLDDFDLALRKYTAGQEVEVVVRRGAEEVTVSVTLAQPRS